MAQVRKRLAICTVLFSPVAWLLHGHAILKFFCYLEMSFSIIYWCDTITILFIVIEYR